MTSTALVLGATGKTGRRLAPLLAAAGVDVRRASRRPDGAGVLFDWDRPETHAPALVGVDAVFVVLPEMVADPSPVTGPFLERAAASGVHRVVLLSSLGVELRPGVEAGFGRVERQVRESGLEWTILRPSGFNQNFSEGFLLPPILEQGVIPVPAGSGAVSLVDADDIAAVAAAALTRNGHAKAEYTLTGPEAITFAQAAELIGEAAGRPVAHLDIPRQALLDTLTGHGMPADYAEMVVSTFDAIRAGEASVVSDDVQRVTGRPAITFAGYVQGAADAWRQPSS